MSEKEKRQQHLLSVLERNPVASQEELQDLLYAEGVNTTQSTLSRDLRELGIVKNSHGYDVSRRRPAGPDRLPALSKALGSKLKSVDWGANLVVLKLREGISAKEIAARIESTHLHQAVAALPCEDAVLVVARTQAYAREIVQALRDRPRRSRRRF